ncbi:MAG: hypothetical protein DRJ65_17565 [Acidobacteria bacterium]|nr:MAG: hypothetical protein DRJ65_17565 [Acidobacteriota bacterium]
MSCLEHQTLDRDTGRSINANVTHAGEDLVIVVTGGRQPHVGTIVLAQPSGSDRSGVSCSVMTIPPHKEEAVARPIAESVCKASGQVTVVTAGIHEDNLDTAGIRVYLDLAQQMASELAERFR